MNQSKSLFGNFFKKLDKAREVLDAYQNDPSEENVHDVRTSIRRLESSYMIFPKSCKTKASDLAMKTV